MARRKKRPAKRRVGRKPASKRRAPVKKKRKHVDRKRLGWRPAKKRKRKTKRRVSDQVRFARLRRKMLLHEKRIDKLMKKHYAAIRKLAKQRRYHR